MNEYIQAFVLIKRYYCYVLRWHNVEEHRVPTRIYILGTFILLHSIWRTRRTASNTQITTHAPTHNYTTHISPLYKRSMAVPPTSRIYISTQTKKITWEQHNLANTLEVVSSDYSHADWLQQTLSLMRLH